MYFNTIALTTALLAGSSMAEIIWDGRFTKTSAAEIGKWSWENQVGAYQYYIHGPAQPPTTSTPLIAHPQRALVSLLMVLPHGTVKA